jgi:hypothetical protein
VKENQQPTRQLLNLYLDMVAAAVVGDLSQSGHVVSLEAMHELQNDKHVTKSLTRLRKVEIDAADSSVFLRMNYLSKWRGRGNE